jgi:hypothetical protein
VKPQTKRNLLIAGGAIAAAGVLYLVFRSSNEASGVDVDRVVSKALTAETDPSILRTLSTKLRAAGRTAQAYQVDQRAQILTGAKAIVSSDSGATKTVQQILKK